MNEQHANVGIALLADASETSSAAGGELARREAEPAGEVSPAPERVDVCHSGGESGRGEQADARNPEQCLDHGLFERDALEFRFDRLDPLLEVTHLLPEYCNRAAHASREHVLFAREELGQVIHEPL